MNVNEVSINRRVALFTDANPMSLSIPGSNSHVPISQNKESDNILGTVSPTTSSLSSETEQRHTKRKRKSYQKVTSDVAKRIMAVALKIESSEISIKKAALECGIDQSTLKRKLQALKSGKDLTKRNPRQKITPEIAKRIRALAPKIESSEISIKKAALECGIAQKTLRVKLQALKSGKELTEVKPYQKITPDIAKKIKALAPKIERSEKTIKKAALECGISDKSLRDQLQVLKSGKELTKRKTSQKTTSEIAERIKELAPKIENGNKTIQDAALECGISDKSIRNNLQIIKSGKELTKRKPQQKITPEIIEKIKALAPKIESGEKTIKNAALECDISVSTLMRKLQALKSGKDLTKRKPQQKITPEIIEKIKALAPKIESGEKTIKNAALEYGIDQSTLSRKLQAFKSGKELTERKPRQKITPEIVEKIKALAPKIESGKTTTKKAALECCVSHAALTRKLQALKSGKDLINRAAAEDPQVPMTPVKLPDAELLTYLCRSEQLTI